MSLRNPELNLARQRVLEAAAFRICAAAQLLPTINYGTNCDSHTGVLQQANGNILSVNRSAVYVGAGANAVAAGTVNIPGVLLGGNIGQGLFAYLTSRQVVLEREAATVATRNQVFLRVGLAYAELLRAEGIHAVALQGCDEAREVAKLTTAFAATGQGRKSEAARAEADRRFFQRDIQRAEEQVAVASALLAERLNLDPSTRPEPVVGPLEPLDLTDASTPTEALIRAAVANRPDLAARSALVDAAEYKVR